MAKHLDSRVILANGTRRKIGNGTSINVWNGEWLKSMDNPSISTSIIEGLENLIVADHMASTTFAWDSELLEKLL